MGKGIFFRSGGVNWEKGLPVLAFVDWAGERKIGKPGDADPADVL